MKKYGWLILALACAGGMMAQTTDDFFSDDNDSVLEEARRRYGSATATPSPTPEAEQFFSEEEQAWVEVERDGDIDVDIDVHVTVEGPAESPMPTPRPQWDKGDIRLFDGFFLRFGWGDRKEAYSPVVLSLVPGISFPLGMYDTNLACGYIGSLTRSVKGLSASGVMDMIDKDLVGVQAAGVFCMAGGNVDGVQAAGVFNIAGDVKGVQAAGVFNVAASVLGAQSSGVINIAKDVKGVQAAGVVNIARKVTGVQVGLVNLSDEMYGIPIGLFSWTKNGIRDLGVLMDANENIFTFVAHGTSNFYALAMLGQPAGDWFQDWRNFVGGAGLGWRAVHSGWLNLDLDFVYKTWLGRGIEMGIARAEASPQLQYALDNPGDYFEWLYSGGEWNVYSWPSVRGTLALSLGKGLEVFGGLSLDLRIPHWSEIPDFCLSPEPVKGNAFGWDYELHPGFYCGLRF